MPRSLHGFLLFWFLLVSGGGAFAATADTQEVLNTPALMVRHPDRVVLLSVTRAGNRLVAAGERGVIILSDDDGRHWRQAAVPVTATLTRVKFATPKIGWAVGHLGVVLRTDDGGLTWVKQLDGNRAAQIALAAATAAEQKGAGDPQALKRALRDARRLVKDGPDKPFFDLLADDARHVTVVGAFNLAFRSDDGGATWQDWSDHIANPDQFHLYRIFRTGPSLVIAGEQALALAAPADGGSFAPLNTGYDGTFFVGLAPAPGAMLLAGMRGNAFLSRDDGKTWVATRSSVAHPETLNGGTVLADGTLLLVDQGGRLLVSRDHGLSLAPVPGVLLFPLVSVAAAPDGALVVAGLGGVDRLPRSVLNNQANGVAE